MNISIIKGLLLTILLLLTQTMVLNNIHLFGCATPLMLVYIIMLMSSNTPRWALLLLGFTLGIISDIFSNTPGVAAASLTLVAFIQPLLLRLFVSTEDNDELWPSMQSMGTTKFLGYTLMHVLLFNITFYSLEQFNFFQIQQWCLYIIGSTLLTTMLIFALEGLRKG